MLRRLAGFEKVVVALFSRTRPPAVGPAAVTVFSIAVTALVWLVAGPGGAPRGLDAQVVCTHTWTNAAGGDFNDPLNWSPQTLPEGGAIACVGLAGTYTISVDATWFFSFGGTHLVITNADATLDFNSGNVTQYIGGISSTGTVRVSNNSTLQIISGGVYQVARWQVDAGSTLDINSRNSVVDNAGVIVNNGLVRLIDATYNHLPGGSTAGANPVQSHRTLLTFTGNGPATLDVLSGDTSLRGATTAGQTLTVFTDATLRLAEHVTNGGLIVLTAGAPNRSAFILGDGFTLTNTGTIRTLPGTGTGDRFLHTNLINQGTLDIQYDTLFQAGGTTLTNDGGGITIAAGTTLFVNASGGLRNQAGSITISGTLRVHSVPFVQGEGTTSGNPVTLSSVTLTFTGGGASRFLLDPAIGGSTLLGNTVAGQEIIVDVNTGLRIGETLTNGGRITLTNLRQHPGGGQECLLFTDSGVTLINTGIIESTAGNNGATRRAITGAAIDNRGRIEVHHDLSLINGGNVTNSGTIAVDAGKTVSFTGQGSTFTHAGGTISNNGVFIHSGGNGSRWTQGDGATSGNPLLLTGPLSITGTGASHFQVGDGSVDLSGAVAAGQSITLIGSATVTPSLRLTGDVTNAGTLVFSSTDPNRIADLTTQSFTLTNTGTIRTLPSSQGFVRMTGAYINRGSFDNQGVTALLSGSQFTNDGGAFTVAAGAQFLVNSGSRVVNTAGNIANNGVFNMVGGNGLAFTQGAGAITGSPVLLQGGNLNLNGSGAGSFLVIGGAVVMTGNIASGQAVIVETGGTIQAPASFTNAGRLTLRDAQGSGNAEVTLASGATMTNTGLLEAIPGLGGAGQRSFSGVIDNQGTLVVDYDLNLVNAIRLINSGTVRIAAGKTLSAANQFAGEKVTLNGAGALELGIGSATQVGRIVTNGISVGGTLRVTTTFSPAPADRFTIIDAGSAELAGTFATTQFTGQAYSVAYSDGDVILAPIAAPPPFAITSVVPGRAANNGDATFTIHGRGFAAGATVRLGGQAPLRAGVGPGDTVITATFDLHGAAPGPREVVVTNPGGQSVTLANAVVVEAGPQIPGASAMPWVTAVGPAAYRPGRPLTFHVVYGNNGTADAVGVPVFISGLPAGVGVVRGFATGALPRPPQISQAAWDNLTMIESSDGTRTIAVLIDRIPPGVTGNLPITLTTTPGANNPVNVTASICNPIIGSGVTPSWTTCVQILAEIIKDLIPGVDCGTSAIQAIIQAAVTIGYGTQYSEFAQALADAILQCITELNPALATFELVIDVVKVLWFNVPQLASCIADVINYRPAPLISIDPNDKQGPAGSGAPQRFIPGTDVLPYLVHFENLATAKPLPER